MKGAYLHVMMSLALCDDFLDVVLYNLDYNSV